MTTAAELAAKITLADADLDRLNGAVNDPPGTFTTDEGTLVRNLRGRLEDVGYLPPVAFAAGLEAQDASFTVTFDGRTYHADPNDTPFTTTATFNPSQWISFERQAVINEVARASGDGTTTTYTLPISVVDENNVDVIINGVQQFKTSYVVLDKTLTFVTAPPAGTNNIEFNCKGAYAGVIETPVGPEDFINRAAFVSWVAGGGTASSGLVISDGTVQYVASTGATAIADLPGWLPFGEWRSAHFPATQATINILDVDHIGADQLVHIRADDVASQDATVVTSGVRSMMDAAMAFVSGGVDRYAYVTCSGSYAVNDELFSETFADNLWNLNGSVGQAKFYFQGRARFFASSWVNNARPRTSGFYSEQGITDAVPAVMFRWEQRAKFQFSPYMEGWEFYGEADIATDPIGLKCRNINTFDLNFLVEKFAQGGIHISDMNNGGSGAGLYGSVSRCGATITGAGGTGFLPSGARFTATPGAGTTTVEIVDVGGGPYTGTFSFTSDHVGREFSVNGAAENATAFTANIASVVNSTTIVLDRQATAAVVGQTGSFTYLPVATTAASASINVPPNMTTDLTGRYVGLVGAQSSLHSESGTPYVRVVSHDLATGAVVLARPVSRTMARTALITGPSVFIGKDEDQVQPDGVSPEFGHNNDVRVSLRIENGSIGYSAVNMLGQYILGTQFIGTKWHGVSPTFENYGSNWAALVLDNCKMFQGTSDEIEWGGYSADYGKICVTGARNNVVISDALIGDAALADSCAIAYTDPINPGRDNCRVYFSPGCFLNNGNFPVARQAVFRNGANGRQEHVQGAINRRDGVVLDMTSVLGSIEAIGATPTITMRDSNAPSPRSAQTLLNGSEYQIRMDTSGDDVYDTNVLRYTDSDLLQIDQGAGWITAFNEGVFTPSLTIGGTPIESLGGAYASRSGQYQVIAGICWVKIAITLSAANSSGSGGLAVTVPSDVRPAEFNDSIPSGIFSGFSGLNGQLFGATQGSSLDSIVIREAGAGGTGSVAVTDTNITNTSRLEISGTYKI